MTFAPGRDGVSLSIARPHGISGAPKLHSQVKPTKSICPFQYLEIINSSKLRYYKRKLLVNLFSHRSGWIWSLQAPGTLKGQGGHFILPHIPGSLVESPRGDTHNTITLKKKTKSRLTYRERNIIATPPLVPSKPHSSPDGSGPNNPPAADQHPNQAIAPSLQYLYGLQLAQPCHQQIPVRPVDCSCWRGVVNTFPSIITPELYTHRGVMPGKAKARAALLSYLLWALPIVGGRSSVARGACRCLGAWHCSMWAPGAAGSPYIRADVQA